MTEKELELLKRLPLDIKIAKTKRRIEEWVYAYGLDRTYVSFSGGKDSTVLLHIARQLYPNILAVYCDTGLEYPEVKKFINKQKNVLTIRPEMGFKEVLETYGYPVVSKEQSKYIHEIRHSTSKKIVDMRLHGIGTTRYKLSEKWKYLLDAPFEISSKCCDVMKKKPFYKFQMASRRKPILGTLAEESSLRTQAYLKTGCNNFKVRKSRSTPMAFWTNQDVLRYIKENNLEIPSVYGDIVEDDGVYKTTKLKRTGCVFCLFGIENDSTPNRIQMLKETHRDIYDYCLGNLKLKEVMDFMNIPYN